MATTNCEIAPMLRCLHCPSDTLSPSLRSASDDGEMGLVTISGARHHNLSTNFEEHSAPPQGKPADKGVSSCGFLDKVEDEERVQHVDMQNALGKKEKVKSTTKKKKNKEKKERRKVEYIDYYSRFCRLRNFCPRQHLEYRAVSRGRH